MSKLTILPAPAACNAPIGIVPLELHEDLER